MNDYEVKIRGEYTEDDGLRLDLGPLAERTAWWEHPLPPCPDCGGDVVWYEAGYTPGARKCLGPRLPGSQQSYEEDGGCGSMFEVHGAGDAGQRHIVLTRARFYT